MTESDSITALKSRIVDALRTVFDPEIPVNIYDLGLIYGLDADESGQVRIRMTLTSANCPIAQDFPETVEYRLRRVPGVSDVEVELVWEPPWGRERMSQAALLELGML